MKAFGEAATRKFERSFSGHEAVLVPLCDHSIVVPSDETPRIQEMHIMIGHVLCDLLEDC